MYFLIPLLLIKMSGSFVIFLKHFNLSVVFVSMTFNYVLKKVKTNI